MDTKQAEALMNKMNTLIAAADEFGSQSEQLAAARGDFDEYLKAVKSTDETMISLISKCDEFVNALKTFADEEIAEKYKDVVKYTEDTITACKNSSEEVSKAAENVIDDYENIKTDISTRQNEMVGKLERGLGDMASTLADVLNTISGKIDAAKLALTLTTEKLATSVDEGKTQMKEDIDNLSVNLTQKIKNLDDVSAERVEASQELIRENTKMIIDEIDAASQKEEKLIANVKNELIENMKTELEILKSQQRRDHTLILAALIAAVVAAGASIAGLVM